MELIKSSSEDEIEKLSERLESYLIDISSYMRRVVSCIFFLSLITFSFSMLVPPRGGGGGGSFIWAVYRYMCGPKGHGFKLFWSQIEYRFCNLVFNWQCLFLEGASFNNDYTKESKHDDTKDRKRKCCWFTWVYQPKTEP